MNGNPSRNHGLSFLLKETLRKELLAYAAELDDHFHGSWIISSSATPTATGIPRSQFDAWVTFQTWLAEGEPVSLLDLPVGDPAGNSFPSTGSQEPVLQTSLRDEAMAFRLGDEGDWILLARHTEADGRSEINEGLRGQYGCPTLTFVWNILGVRSAGAIPLHSHTCWDQVPWPEGDAWDPVTEQRRVLTKRVRHACRAAITAALGEFGKSQPVTRPSGGA